MNLNEAANMEYAQGGPVNINTFLQRQQNHLVNNIKEQYKTLLLSIASNPSSSIQTIIVDAIAINSMPANRVVIKEFGW